MSKRKVQTFARLRMTAELMLALLAALALVSWRLGLRAGLAPEDRRVTALAFAGVAAAAAAMIAARRSNGGHARFWLLIAAASIAWEPGRAAPHGAPRGALLVFNGGFLVGAALFAIALSLAIHTTTHFGARIKLALDFIPQLIGLAVFAWLGWIGPQVLHGKESGWFGAIVVGHGLVDILLFGLCATGLIGRRQGVAGEPPMPLLAGVGLLAAGDAASWPVWERSVALLTASSECALAIGFGLIGLTAIRAWRPRRKRAGTPGWTNTSSWTSQMPHLVLIGLLLVAVAQLVDGERVEGGVATAVVAGIVIIVFGMARQSLTTRSERRLHQEIDQLSSQIDGLVSQVGRDPLTGLLNHRAVHERLEQEIEQARAGGSSLAVALVDVDNFKTINDRRGHQAGDRVLRAISSILTAACRGTDVAARYAGDEFLLIFPGLDEAHAASACERIVHEVRRINRRLNLGHDVGVTLSVGVAVGRKWSQGAQKIVGIADAAMYDAKETGKDRVVVVNADTLVAIGPEPRDAPISANPLPLQRAVKDRRRRRPRFERAS